MADMLTLRNALLQVPGVRFVRPSGAVEDEMAKLVKQPKLPENATLVEDSVFRAIDVTRRDETGFTHFLDGSQFVRRVGFHGLQPVLVAHVSAAIVERIDREIKAPRPENYRVSQKLYVPSSFPGDREDPHFVRVALDDCGAGSAATLKYKEAIEDERKSQEDELSKQFREGVLLIDGGIDEALRGAAGGKFIVGLVKSHETQYFATPDRVQTIIELKEGQRTTVFERPAMGKSQQEVFSFYLKLREDPYSSPMFGLARIEVAPSDEMLKQVDAISSWLMHERAPLSLPDPRYDRLLYPIRLVEQYLKAHQPSEVKISQITRL